MAMRKVITIDEEKCDGCGECVTSCAEGAIAIIDGKARLVSETYCDGLGACLGHCPQGAIAIDEREAPAFDEVKTREHLKRMGRAPAATHAPAAAPAPAAPHACPGTMLRMFNSLGSGSRSSAVAAPPQSELGGSPAGGPRSSAPAGALSSELGNWPIQLMLVPPQAPYLQGADILLVADCVPFAYADFHRRFLRGRPVIIGCPKLDQADFYVKKLAQIIHTAQPRSISILRMEVPCCSGLTRIVQLALSEASPQGEAGRTAPAGSGTAIPHRVKLEEVVISIQGEILSAA
jgi:NAD-dependent dihydropyrimidine dehydrogenase PreA subunit